MKGQDKDAVSIITNLRQVLCECKYTEAVDLLRLCYRRRYPALLIRSVLSDQVFYLDTCYLDLSLISPEILLFPYLPPKARSECGLNAHLIDLAHNCTLEEFVLHHLNSVLRGDKSLCPGIPAIDIREYRQRLVENKDHNFPSNCLSAIEYLMLAAAKKSCDSIPELDYWRPSWNDKYYRPRFAAISLSHLACDQIGSLSNLAEDFIRVGAMHDYRDLTEHAAQRTLEGKYYYFIWNSSSPPPRESSSYVYALASRLTNSLNQIELRDDESYDLVEVSLTDRPSLLLIDSAWCATRQPEEIHAFFQSWTGYKTDSPLPSIVSSFVPSNLHIPITPQLRKPPETILVLLATRSQISHHGHLLLQKWAKKQAYMGGFINSLVLCTDKDHPFSIQSWQKTLLSNTSHNACISFIGIRDSVAPYSSREIIASLLFSPNEIICTDEEIIWDRQSRSVGQRQYSAKVTLFRVITRGHIPGLVSLPLSIFARLNLADSYLSIHALLKDIVLQHIHTGGAVKTLPCALLHRDIATNPAILSISYPPQRKLFDSYQLAEIKSITQRRSGKWLDRSGKICPAKRNGCFSIRYTGLSSILVSVVIPFRDAANLTRQCVESLLDNSGTVSYEIILVDNGSKSSEAIGLAAELSQIASQRGVLISAIRDESPFNFSRINNSARKLCRGQYILFANNDIIFRSKGCLNSLLDPFAMIEVAAVGARLLYEDGTIQHNGLMSVAGEVYDTLSPGKGLSPGWETDCFIALENQEQWSAATAACLMVRASDFDLVNGFDESFVVAYNDVDLCWKINNASKAVVVVPDVHIIHAESKTRGNDLKGAKRIRLYAESHLLRSRHSRYFKLGDYLAHPYLDPSSPRFRSVPRPAEPVSLSRDELLFTWISPVERKKSSTPFMIYVHWDPSGCIREDIIDQLRAYRDHTRLAFVSAAPELVDRPKDLEVLKSLCDVVVVRRNEGYDFGSWRAGISFCDNLAGNAEWLILVNDSCLGPFYSVDRIFNALGNACEDVVGLTDNLEISYHLQSYFIAYHRRVHRSPLFNYFWKHIGVWNTKMDLIRAYEVGWSQSLANAGFSLGALYGKNSYGNLTHIEWRSLIEDRGFPFVKVELIRDNPLEVDLSGLVSFLQRYNPRIASSVAGYRM